MSVPDSVIIVGCGVFGLSTGLALSKRYPNSTIHLTDRHEPPVSDGTSVDTTRVIRADYHDPVYSSLALEAQRALQADPELAPYYHRSGMIYAHAGPDAHGSAVWQKEFKAAGALQEQRIREGEFGPDGYIKHLGSHEAIFKRVNGGAFEPQAGEKLWNEGYLNEDVGFVDAEACVRVYYQKVRRQANTRFTFGNPVKRLVIEEGVAKGVEFEDGAVLRAGLVVLAAGAWSNALCDLRDQIEVDGHEVAWLKVEKEMEERYRDMPITTNFTTGFNIFPPLNGYIKCLRRSPGYTNTTTHTIPTPTPTSPTTTTTYTTSTAPTHPSPHPIPAAASAALRQNLAELFPPLATTPFARTRLCYFTNTPTSDFLICRHPRTANLALATGGSAHGWKFLCVLGDRVVQMLEGELAAELVQKWAWKGRAGGVDMEGAPRAKGERVELRKALPVAVVGAGVFGLSTALWLRRRGWEDVTLYDREPYDKTGYENGTAASADENKILRASYGDRALYQTLAFRAMEHWTAWNAALSSAPAAALPPTLAPTDTLWNPAGFLRLSDHGLDEHEHTTQANFPPDKKHTQHFIGSAAQRAAATEAGVPATKLDPFGRVERGLPTDGVFDATGGYVLASKACAWALHLCAQASVQLRLGPSYSFARTTTDAASGAVTGIAMADGTTYPAATVVVACGGYTPALVPEADRILETTAGSVLTVRLPPRRADLWARFDPARFPVWSWKMAGYARGAGAGSSVSRTSVGGLYGFPRTPEGVVKFGFRGAKWTSFTHRRAGAGEGEGEGAEGADAQGEAKGRLVSYPVTGGAEVPEAAMRVVQAFCQENLPELLALPIEKGRLCWYTDSVDNEFLIDRVPGRKGVVVASGGSGHGFKFLPVLGEHVADVLEGRETEYTRAFRWRERPEGKANGLEEGPEGWRTLGKQKLTGGWLAKL